MSNNTTQGTGSLPNDAGTNNSSFGAWSMYATLNGGTNSAVGTNALYNNQGSDNTGLGAGTLYANTTGDDNTAVGVSALGGGSSLVPQAVGDKNVAIGKNALYNNTNDLNVAIGYGAGEDAVGTNNVFVGASATGGTVSNSVAIGSGAVVTESNQIMLGGPSVTVLAPGSAVIGGVPVGSGEANIADNVVIGGTQSDNTTGVSVTAVGVYSLEKNTVDDNTGIGYAAGQKNVSGVANTSVGSFAMQAGEGSNNVAVGCDVVRNASTINDSTCIGTYTAINAPTVQYSTLVGFGVLQSLTVESDANTIVGCSSGSLKTAGTKATYVGASAGNGDLIGSSNTCIGYNSGVTQASSSSPINNSTAIGVNASATQSNQIVLGTTGETVAVPGTLTANFPPLDGTGDLNGWPGWTSNSSVTLSCGYQSATITPTVTGGSFTGGSNGAIKINAIRVGGITTLTWEGTGTLDVSGGDEITELTYALPQELLPANDVYYPCIIESNGQNMSAQFSINISTPALSFNTVTGGEYIMKGPGGNAILPQSVTYISNNNNTGAVVTTESG